MQLNSSLGFQPRFDPVLCYTIAVILGLLILCTIIGNVFVVAAILLEKNLQNVSNYLIMSLAVADLLVATLVMPVSALMEISKGWWLGMPLCDIWVCSDILLCTASILHLVAIAIDRYQAVSSASYLQTRSRRKIIGMIVACWITATVISIPARFHLSRDSDWDEVNDQADCKINDSYPYTIFSNLGAFYIPMLFMLFIYGKIWQMARERIRKKKFHASMRNGPASKPVENGINHVPLEATVTCGCCYGKYKKVWRGRIWTNCLFPERRVPNRGLNSAKFTHLGAMSGGGGAATYGAVAAGMRMASAIIGTTQSRDNSTTNCGSSNKLRPVSMCSSTSSNFSQVPEADFLEAASNATSHRVPLTYSILYNLAKKTHHQSAHQKLPSLPSQIGFADELLDEDETILPVPARTTNKPARATSPPGAVLGASEEAYHANSTRRSNVGLEPAPPGNNFMTLSAYKKRRKQMRWLDRQHKLEKTAIEAMGMIVFDDKSYSSIDGDDLNPRERLEQKRERKAARTLGIITGCFVLCWLPFFLMSSARPFLSKDTQNNMNLMSSLILWLGYANSLLNPIIYTIFAPDFRNAFRKILFGRYRRRNK